MWAHTFLAAPKALLWILNSRLALSKVYRAAHISWGSDRVCCVDVPPLVHGHLHPWRGWDGCTVHRRRRGAMGGDRKGVE